MGGANGMAIALAGGHVVFETLADGKRSRIDFGFTPEKLPARLDRAQAMLNEIANLEVDGTIVRGLVPNADQTSFSSPQKDKSPL
ncbi:MAG: hypothetical protein IKQ55_04280 [Kiritimatiellae bacterium]|nr:hypothetical protein [Kiritimatiellia bacterium]